MHFLTPPEIDRQAALDARPGRLKRVVSYAYALGEGAIEYEDAADAVEDVLWADGRMPCETRGQKLAWRLAHERAMDAHRRGWNEVALPRIVQKHRAAHGDVWRVAYEVAWECDDSVRADVIADAVGIPLGKPWCPIRKAFADRAAGNEQTHRDNLLEAAVDAQEKLAKEASDAPAVEILAHDDAGVAALIFGASERHVRRNQIREAILANDHDPEPEPGTTEDAPDMTDAPPTNAELDEFVRRLGTSDDPSAAEACQALRRIRLGLKSSTASNCQPVDLWQRYEAPELPAGLLPPVIEEFARSHADIMGADPAGLAMAALVTCAAAVTDGIEVQVKQHDPTWRESARLWVGLVGMPSTKKSPLISAAMAPLLKLDQAMAERNATAMQAFLALPKIDQAKRARPKQPQYVVEDATIESLQEVLKDTPRGLIAKHPELSGWFGGMDKYNPGKGAAADRAFWLKSYDGGSYNLNRVARGAAIIPNLSINLLGGIQPEPLRKAVGDSVDDGLIQRLIPVILKPARVGKDSPTGTVVADYRALVERLVRLEAHANGNLGRPAPLTLSEEARAVRVRLELEHVELVGALEDASPKLAAHFGKHDGLFARLCLIWHCIENVDRFSDAREINGETAERVAAFMRDFLRPSAIAFYSGMLGLSAGHEEVMALAAHIVSANLSEVTARDVQRSTRKLKAFTALEACRLCEKLEAFGWLEPTDSRAKSNSPRWKVVPAVHTLFEDRGRAESERRALARAALKEALNP